MSSLCITDPITNHFKWVKHIKEYLDQSGFGWIWDAEDIDIDVFNSMFKRRRIDIFIQKWQAEMGSNSQCSAYKMFKKDHGIENYIQKIEPIHQQRQDEKSCQSDPLYERCPHGQTW